MNKNVRRRKSISTNIPGKDNYYHWDNKEIDKKRLKKTLIIIVILVSIISIVFFTDLPIWRIYIKPMDYQIKIGVWGDIDHTNYTSIQKSELNDHKVTIYGGMSVETNESRTNFITEMQYWKTNYSDIDFYIGVGGFVWDGITETVLEQAIETIEVIENNSLTNIKGLVFDFENPLASGHISYPFPDFERHNDSIYQWIEFFDWAENNTDLEFISTTYSSLSTDLINDADYDLHLIFNIINYEVPRFNYYMPMIYRAMPIGDKPYGSPGVFNINTGGDFNDLTWEFYHKINLFQQSLSKVETDYKDKSKVLLGLLNASCYSANKTI